MTTCCRVLLRCMKIVALFGVFNTVSPFRLPTCQGRTTPAYRRASLVTLNDQSQAKLNPHVEGVGAAPLPPRRNRRGKLAPAS